MYIGGENLVRRRVPYSELTGPERVRAWIDIAAYGGGKLARGILPLIGGTVAASELLAPDYLTAIAMSPQVCAVVLSVCAGALVPGMKTSALEQKDG